MKEMLCVIDMQAGFSSSDDALNGCIRLVKNAVNKKMPIIFVEYEGYGPTLSTLTNIAKETKPMFCQKQTDDGAREIVMALEEVGYNYRDYKIRVCGVNACYCVKDTYEQLKSYYRANLKPMVSGMACTCNDKYCFKTSAGRFGWLNW